jgi:RNA polymerase sigma factor (sigma-70 family)
MHESDPGLVEACLAGRKDAWDALVEQYGRLVYSVLYKCRVNGTDAEDLFQTTFTLLFRNLARLRDQQRLSAWLITTAKREAWRMHRYRARQGASSQDQVEQEPAAATPDETAAEELQLNIRKALTTLGGSCERLLRALFFADGEPSYEEISRRLEIPVGSIGPTRARCFKKLQEILAGLGVTDADL